MVKRFQFIYDFTQYNLSLSLIEDEMVVRGWEIVKCTPKTYNLDKDVRGSISCQTGDWIHKKPPSSPSFLVFHGVSFIKNWARCYPDWDYVIVPSKFFEDNVSGNVLGLGWSKSDYYINNKDKKQVFKELIKKHQNIENDKPIILFAPTYSKSGGLQIPGNADKLMEIVSYLSNYNVIFMPHEMCDYKNKYKDYRFTVKSSYSSKWDYLLGSDLLISDTSSLVFEFALLDKPIVLLENTKYTDYLKVSGSDMTEFLDLGDVISVDCLDGLEDSVSYSLNNPEKYTNRRKYWVDKSLSYCDGNSTKRIVDKMEEICG